MTRFTSPSQTDANPGTPSSRSINCISLGKSCSHAPPSPCTPPPTDPIPVSKSTESTHITYIRVHACVYVCDKPVGTHVSVSRFLSVCQSVTLSVRVSSSHCSFFFQVGRIRFFQVPRIRFPITSILFTTPTNCVCHCLLRQE